MTTKLTNIIVGLLIVVSTFVGFFLYPSLPEKMASHWNFYGEVDGYMGKFWGVVILPLIASILWAVFLFIPRLDPLKKNVESFRSQFNTFIIVIIGFLVYLYYLTLLWNIGYQFDLGRYMMVGMGILFYYVGVMLEHSKRNWFIGIRTPWTLSSDRVWKKTHELGAKLFKVSGAVILIGFFLPLNPFFFIFIPVVSSSVFVLVYSYWEYRKISS